MLHRLRLASGLLLFSYLATHLLNHSAGIASPEALEAGRRIFLAMWRNPVGTLLLYAALLLHLGLAYWSLYRRRSLKMPRWEALQLGLGFLVPPLLAIHILGTRLAHEVLGFEDSYAAVLLVYFRFDPGIGLQQLAATLVAWLHACIGLHFWLRLKPWYGAAKAYLYALALLLPVVALLGLWMAGREVLRRSADPQWLEAVSAEARFADAEGYAFLKATEAGIVALVLGLLVAVLAARGLRAAFARRHGLVQLSYPGGRRILVAKGTSILDASRDHGVPHAAVCGGRGRCSTCRVRLGDGSALQPPASQEEIHVLARIGAPPNVRLACQTQVAADCEVTPLLPPSASPRDGRPGARYLQGQEREIAILFADLRAFTSLSENKLPYDVVFILNRYFAAMGTAVEEAGGRVDKFIGDGVMALFGVEQGIETGSRQALAAARLMGQRLEELNRALVHDLEQPLRIGIGLHSGTAIVGEMGYRDATSVTAVGDAVNTASRLEALTKTYGAELVVSEPLVAHAGLDFAAFPRQEIEVRGRIGQLAVRVVESTQSLPG